MRAWRSIFGLIVSAAALPCAAEEKFPYTAYINADDVYVRSGPGQNYYPTVKLSVGQEVEVYRHDPGGWYAVRPPEGSFSWVAVRYLKPGHDNIAVVNGDRVVARVGSSFSDVRDVIQVRLERGEEVEILDTKTLDAGQGGEKWAKIAPVAGEFRWVLGKFLDRTPPEAKVAVGRNAGGSWTLAKRSDDDEPESTDADRTTDSPKVGFRPVKSAEDADGRSVARPASFDKTGADRSTKNEEAEKEPAPPKKSNSGSTIKPADFQAEIDQIDLEISQMVAEEPTVWAFDELRTRAETALARAQTAVERGRARLVLNKVQRFQEIKDRFQRVAATNPTIPPPMQPPAATPATAANSAAPPANTSAAPNAAQYASGRLTSVVSFRIGSPHFALVDDAGGVRAYVTPAPGVNLRPFLGRQVGIAGARTFLPEFNAAHVTAQQIAPLERTALR
jgi:hypothetical protein